MRQKSLGTSDLYGKSSERHQDSIPPLNNKGHQFAIAVTTTRGSQDIMRLMCGGMRILMINLRGHCSQDSSVGVMKLSL
ncbi:hypothetical protein TNCV_4202811 [Trichonephila clavipes]|uniref:Uncharacterized protein n=1 Tax=Trichonephila clavipes TaxID=2585209 RepID=A0A8X6VI93_TRICX|nr:hypothetical protein TNCV_4202811 [Trichonephila clavipes]